MNSSKTTDAFQVQCSPGFPAWLRQQRISLAFSTYQLGKLFLVGTQASGRLGIFERSFNRCMGLWVEGESLWLASAYQIWKLTSRSLSQKETAAGFDCLYVPSLSYVTGDVDVHDLALGGDGRPVFCNTRFSCIATISDRASFEPIWHPPFISRISAEDRCHLNGMACELGEVRYASACSTSDTPQGWRQQRDAGGCIVDTRKNELVLEGLSMPHSPRLHQGRLWVLNSGHGQFGFVDLARGQFEAVEFCPGYARGLGFVGKYAVIGLSRPREATFAGLPLDAELALRSAAPVCGLQIVDFQQGNTIEWLQILGRVEELYDVAVIPDVIRPKALGLKTDEIQHNAWLIDEGRWSRWTAKEVES